jgi:phosphoenolpyruvate carboxylase
MAEAIQESNLSAVLTDLNARIRILEGKYTLFGERLLVINQNMVEEYRKLMKETKLINHDIQQIRQDIFNLKDILTNITKEMALFARNDKLKVLEKYINFWNPLHFMTEEDVIRIIRREHGKERSTDITNNES